MEASIKGIGDESIWNLELGPAIKLGKAPVSIKTPKDWGATLLTGDVDAKRRLLPLEGASLAGLQQTYEGFVGVGELTDGKQAQSPYYCYLAVNDTTVGRLKDPAAALKSRFKNRLFAGNTGKFQPVAITTPIGQSLQWRKVTAEGPQEFYYVDAQGKELYVEQPGLIELYSYTQGKYQVMICWRLPSSLKANVKVEAWSKLMAGSVTFPQ